MTPTRRSAMIAVALAACVLAACAGKRVASTLVPEGDVSYTGLEPPDPERHELGEDEDFRYGAMRPDHRALPVYPRERLGHAPVSVAVCIELHVDEQGRVADTRALVQSGGCPALAPVDAPFLAAVDHAVRQWAFEPSVVCRLRDDGVADGTCEDASSREAVALLRAYRFVFVQTASGPTVMADEH